MSKAMLKAKLGFVLLVLTLFFLPMGFYRPNRVSRGEPISAWTALGAAGVAIAAVLFGILVLYAFRTRKYQDRRLDILGWVSAVMPGLYLVFLNRAVVSGVDPFASGARISVGAGLWLFLAGVVLIQSTLRRSGAAILLTFALMILPAMAGWTSQLALYKEFIDLQATFFTELQRHLVLALGSAVMAILPGVILGYWCHRHIRSREFILSFVNFFQVAPTLSLLGLIMIPLTALAVRFPFISDLGIRGIGFAPAFIVLFLYCLLPITANTYAGFDQVDVDVVQSAQAMGMRPGPVFRRVLLPLAAPVIMSGIRTAVTQNLGNTILAGLIGGGGMGALIFLGLSQSASDMVVLGTIPVVLMAMMSDGVFKHVEEKLKVKIGASHDSVQ